MKPTLILRPVAVSDLDRIFALVDRITETPHWPRESYRQILSQDALLERFALVAYTGEVLAGFAVASLAREENLAELEMIAVDSSFRRRGIGSAVLKAVMEAARDAGAGAMHLEVRPSNKSALALYRGRGFQESGRRPSYYSDPVEDALILEAALCAADVQ